MYINVSQYDTVRVCSKPTFVTRPLKSTVFYKFSGDLHARCVVPLCTLTAEDHFTSIIRESADAVDWDVIDEGLALFALSLGGEGSEFLIADCIQQMDAHRFLVVQLC